MWARGVTVYGRRPESFEGYHADSLTALEVLTWQLQKTGDWLALGRPTLAEISCYPYVKRAPEGDIPLEPWPEVCAWLARCETIPGWFPLDP